MAIIVGIHGLANKPKRTTEATWWETAIKEGLRKNCNIHIPDVAYHMVYWADLLYSTPLHDDTGFNFDPLYNDESYIEAAPGALRKHDPRMWDKVKAGVLGAMGTAMDAVGGNATLAQLSDLAFAKTLKTLRDLAFYYDPHRTIRGRDGHRRQARLVLMAELKNVLRPLKGQRMMLIAHSMGTIIAYDVLRDLGQEEPDFAVAQLVTIGSPLGLPYVKERVQQERAARPGAPVRTPTIVTERWVNYADRGDPVATDVHLADDYQANHRGIRVEDDLVHNDYVGLNGKPNPHKAYGYFRTPELSEHIRAF
jgi:hypothetical protein